MRDGWVETKLVDAVEVLDRFRKPINSTEREGRQGSVPYFGANGQAGWIDDFIFNEELVLLGEDAIDFADPNARKAYLISGPSWVNNHAHVLRAKSEKVDSYFLAESLNKVDYSQYVSFGTRSKLTQGSMNGIKVLLPPLAEQKRIVDLISSVDSYIEALQKQLESAKKSRNAVLFELLGGTSDKDKKPLIELAKLQRGHDLPTQDRVEGLVPVVASNGVVGFHNTHKANRPGVVTGRSGTIGKVIYIDSDFWPLNTTLYVIDFKGNNPKFVALVLETLKLENYAGGSTVPSLDRNVLSHVPVPCPNIEEQERVVEIIQSFEQNIVNSELAIVKARNLRAGLLSDLLSGKHEIPASYDKVIGAA
jgi:type I restriction enzyme S subunit